MIDREKVIKGLEYCEFGSFFPFCENDCPYYQSNDCTEKLKNDILVLLKEQETVSVQDPGAYCPKCGWMLYPEDHPHHCGNCGQAVKWNA